MSNKTVLIWLAVALSLGGVAWLMLGRGGGTAPKRDETVVQPGERVFSFVPSQATGLSIARSGAPTQFLRRDPDSGEWTLIIRGADGKDGPAWPMGPGRVDNLLRELSSTMAVAKPEAGMEIGSRPTVVSLSLNTGADITFRLAERTIGGSGLLVVDETPAAAPRTEGGQSAEAEPARRAVVTDAIHKVFTNPGPTAWRETGAMPGLEAHASRISLSNDTGEISFARVGARWSVTQPEAAAGAPVNPEAVKQLLTNLAAVRIVEFLDSDTGEAGQPIAQVSVEADVRTAEGEATRVIRRELAVGGPCGSGGSEGERLKARIDGARTVCIDARPLASLSFDPVGYLSARVAEVPPEDVGTVLIEAVGADAPAEVGRVVRRSLDKWVVLDHEGNETVLADAGAVPINAMLAFLTSSPRDITGFDMSLTPPPSYSALGRVTMLSIGGSPLENLEIGLSPDGRCVARTGKVYRFYPADRVPDTLMALTRRPTPGGGAAIPPPKTDAEK